MCSHARVWKCYGYLGGTKNKDNNCVTFTQIYAYGVQADEVTRVHFDTKSTYTVMINKGTAIFKCKLADPEPCMPDGFDLVPDTVQGDYVRVHATTVVNMQRSNRKYRYDGGEHLILTLGWEEFDDSMGAEDLLAGDDFLLYYQQIDTKTAACKIKKTARDTTKESSEDTEEDKSEDEQPAKKKIKKWQTLKNQLPASNKRGRAKR